MNYSLTEMKKQKLVSAGALTNSGGALQGPLTGIKEQQVAVLSTDNNPILDLNAGSFFSKTISAATYIQFSNVPVTGQVSTIILELTNGGAFPITWPSNVKWSSGLAPQLTVSGVDILGFYFLNGTCRGVVLSKDSK